MAYDLNVNGQDYTLVNVGRLCRICLREDDEQSINVLKGNSDMVEHVYGFFGVQINRNEHKTSMLCSICQEKINTWLNEKKKAEDSQIVVNFLSSRTSAHVESIDSVELQTNNSVDYNRANITSPISNNSITTFKSTGPCPFCYNNDKTVKIDVKNICKKHSSPYACLVPTCFTVFTSKALLIHHYRLHLNLGSNSYLCHICLDILGCRRSETKTKHTHQNLLERFTCCSQCFPTMTDFAYHKLLEHNGSIVSRKYYTIDGPNIDPLNQNIKRSRRNQNLEALRSSKRVKVDETIDTPKIPETFNSYYTGIYVCKLCPTVYPTLSDFVEHSEKSHNIPYQLKENEIKLCPLCDENYVISHFVEHIAKCTNTMKVGDDSLNQYGCVHCQQIFCGMTASKFRNHFNYCRSFEVDGIDDNSEKSRKCKNCMFESTNLENCIQHANSYCIYYKLKMKYAKESHEKDKVMERTKSQKQIAEDIAFVFIKPESDNVIINPPNCDWSRQKFLESFNYFCNNCKKGFFSCYVFLNHLTCKGVKCRSNTLIYCTRCVNDFDNVVSFNEHLPIAPPPPSGVPITSTETTVTNVTSLTHIPFIETLPSNSFKVEPSNYELNEMAHFYNEDESMISPVVLDNSSNNQFDDGKVEIETLETNDITFQESEDFKSDIKDIRASDAGLQCTINIIKIDEDQPNINSFSSSDSSN